MTTKTENKPMINTKKTTYQKLAEIKEQLYRIHRDDNDGPRLIHEMLKDLPNPRGPKLINGSPMSHPHRY